MVEQSEESFVVVVASESADRELMVELLVESGLHDAAAGDAHARFDVLSRRPRATIICHRTTHSSPLPRLPAVADRGRVIVFSDCTTEFAIVETLTAGAHHYFDIEESRTVLQARLHAALRSHSRHLERELVVSPYRFDLAKRRVWREDRAVGLSPKEFDLALYLFSHRDRTVSNSELMTAVWSLPRSMDTRRIDTAACRVRKKMGLEQSEGWRLMRLRGEGYLLVPAAR